jgi:hypothetical protein
MSNPSSTRLSAISGHIECPTRKPVKLNNNSTAISTAQAADQVPWNPNNAKFPCRKDLPKLSGAPEGAAWVWGKDDEVCVLLWDVRVSLSLIRLT